MKIVDIIQLCTLIIGRKDPTYVLHVEDFNRVLDLVNRKIFKAKLGVPDNYNPREAVEATGRVIDELRPFKVDMGTNTPPLVFINGFAPIPSNFFYPLSMVSRRVKDGLPVYGRVDLVSELHWQERLTSSITKPTFRDPIARINADNIQILPAEIQQALFSYYRLPNTPIYGVTFDNGYAEYDPATTTEFEYDNITVVEAIPSILNELGFSIPSQEVLAYVAKTEAGQ